MSLPDVPEELKNLPFLRQFLKGLVDSLNSMFSSINDIFVDIAANDIRRDGSVEFTADQSMGGHRITNLGLPLGQNDAANKDYVDSLIGSGGGGGGGSGPMGTTILAVVNQASGSLSPGGSPTALPNSTFTFTLDTAALVAIDVCLYSELGSQTPDSGISCLFAIKNTNTLVSTPAWQDTVAGNASGNPAWSGTIGFPGVKRVLMSLAPGTYNFQITAQLSGSGSFALTYPLSIVVLLLQ